MTIGMIWRYEQAQVAMIMAVAPRLKQELGGPVRPPVAVAVGAEEVSAPATASIGEILAAKAARAGKGVGEYGHN